VYREWLCKEKAYIYVGTMAPVGRDDYGMFERRWMKVFPLAERIGKPVVPVVGLTV
jgi:hypothetical protein